MGKVVKVKVSDFGKIITGKTPSSKFPEDFGSDVLFATPPDFVNQKYIQSTERRLSNIGAEKLNSKLLPPDSVMVTCIGDIGRVALNKSNAITNQQINSIIVDKENFDPHYLYYALNYNKQTLIKNAGKTVVPILNKAGFEEIEISIFQDKSNQQKIAAVLSALDAKIELNQRINAELESMAKTLYDYWFVQFDFPNEKGKPYKSAGGKMVWNEELKREIPLGWEVDELRNHIKINRGVSYTSNDLSDDGIPMVNLNSFYLNGSYKPEGIKYLGSSFKTDRTIKAGDLLAAATDVTRNAYIIGMSFLLPDLFSGQVVASTDALQIEVGSKLDKYYLNMLFNSDSYHKYIKGFATGTLVLHLNIKGIEWYKTILPPKELLNKFGEIKQNIEHKKSLIIKESQTLTELRDWLLPMLMNGQVKVEG